MSFLNEMVISSVVSADFKNIYIFYLMSNLWRMSNVQGDFCHFPLIVFSITCLIESLISSRCFQVFVDEGLWGHSIHLIATNLSEFTSLLPPDSKPEFPSRICLLGNLVEVAVHGLSRFDCTIQLVRLLI